MFDSQQFAFFSAIGWVVWLEAGFLEETGLSLFIFSF